MSNGITQDAFMSKLEVSLNANYTEEQKKFITYMGDGPLFCFASPGTGKTYTAIGGLLNAELFKGIKGDNIYALSFTKLATSELSVRHERACMKLGTHKYVHFNTLHSLCHQILKKHYHALGMSKFDSTGAMSFEKSFELITDTLDEWGENLEPSQIKNVIKACGSLNSSLIFDEDVVKTKMVYKVCKIDYDLFERIRGFLFSYSLLTETISVSDLLLYTVMLLTRHPEISKEFKDNCKLMLIDEAQDLSLLQLRIISLLTDNPVLIGDMKQQIYGFNGACQEVVQEFHKLYPNCVDLELTQSFRCRNEIAEYATKIILPNKVGGENYRGVGDGGAVNLIHGLYENGADIAGLCEKLHNEYVSNKNIFPKEYLFLVRNNISIIPIVEELFKQGLPFRVNNYKPAYDIPLVKELCELLKLADRPEQINNVLALRYLIPEFRGFRTLHEHPLYTVCRSTGCSIFEVNYEFKDPGIATKAFQALIEVHDIIKSGGTVSEMFNVLWPLYEEMWINYTAWKLESKPEYYFDSVSPLIHKNYVQFMQDEIRKQDEIKKNEKYGRGVRCYTMHASKGLEADIVYILDADEGLIPNMSKLDQMVKKQCDMDAARSIREERSLCYVACTRAKEELNIVFNDKPAAMLLGQNPFEQYDAIYGYYKSNGDDISAFESFTRRYVS